MLLAITGNLQAQTYFTENFEGAFTGSPAAPTGWTQERFNYTGDGAPAAITADGAKDWAKNTYSTTWATQNTGAGIVPSTGPVSGTGALWMQDYNFLSNYGVRRLSTPTIDLSTSTIPFVQLYYLYQAGSGGTITSLVLRILASNNGGATYTSIGIIPSTGSNTGWERIAFEVPAAYKVANAKFAIEWTGAYSFGNAFIDDFSILEKPAGNTITADVAGGNWDATATWVGGVVPSAIDDVIIPAGTTVTVSRTAANRLITCQNLTVAGTLTHSTGNHFLLAFGNVTVNSGGTLNLFNGTTGKRFHLFGNLSNAGTVNASVGANLIAFMGGKAATFTNTGTFTSGKINNVWHMNGGGVTYNSPIAIQGVCGLYVGTVNPNGNLTIGVTGNASTIERSIFGSFTASPLWVDNLPSRSVSYLTTTFQPFSQSVITTSHEIRGDSAGRTVTGTLSLSTQDHVSLSYPLSVGNATGGGLTLTRGILQTTSTNILTLSPFISGPAGTAPSTSSPPTTHGSYIVGPMRINFPSTGTTARNFALGRGLNYNGGLTPSNNVLKTVTLGNSVAWTGQTLTASIQGASSGSVNAPLTTLINGITYRLETNGGPDLPATAFLTLLGNNYTYGGGTNSDNLIGDLAQLHIAQSTALTGPWSTRSIPSGSGSPVNNTNVTRNTATGAPGPIGPIATNGEYFSFASSIPSLDIGATALATPGPVGCYTNTQQVKITIRNYGAATIDFSINPVTVNTAITGAATANLSATVNTGTLAPSATLDVTMSGTLDMTATGTYTFNATTVLAGDASASNDAMSAATRTNTAVVTLPQTVDFTGFTGSNLTTLFSNWYEATGATVPSGTTSSWLNRTGIIGGGSNVTAAINLFSNTKRDWIVGPKFTATANTQLKFDAAVTNWNASTADAMGSDDNVQVMVSNDCGATWTAVKTFTAADNLSTTLTPQTVNLGSYNGQNLIVAFFATEGTVDDAEDYDFHIDNVQIAEGSSIDMGATALVTPATTGCLTATENVTVTIRNYGVATINFVTNPVTVTTNVTGAVTTTLTKTVNTGTLAAGATLNVIMDGTLDMTATGTYTFNANTSVAGDGDAMNNNMTSVNRIVTATVSTPLSENFDAGTTLPAGWSTVNTWTIGASHARGGSGNGIYYNIYSSATTATLQLPKAGLISTGDYFNFAYRIVDFTSYPATATSNASNWGNIQVQVSGDCGATYTTLATINNTNHISTTNWAAKAYSLSAYNGQAVVIRIVANYGTGDWYIDLDDISISSTPLPVTITNLKGERKGEQNLLSWTTVSEQNNAGFYVERSADGRNFSSMGFIASKATNGNSNNNIQYNFTDARPFSSSNYYRLKQVDQDGKATYTNVVLVKGVKTNKLELGVVYPNPVTSKLNMLVNAPNNDRITLIISDLSGKVVSQQAVQVVTGDNNLQIDVNRLSSGSYIIKAICASGCEMAVSKFVKQ